MSLSIKKTIVLWYTLWMVMLASLIILLLISGSSFLVERRSRMLLSEIVHDAADDIEIEDGEVEIGAVARDAVELDERKLELLMAGIAAALALARAEHAAHQIGEAARDVEQGPLAGGLEVGDGGFNEVTAALELVPLREILPAVFRMLNGDVGVQIAVRLLRAGDKRDRLVSQRLKGAACSVLNAVGDGLDPFVEVGVLENGALMASLQLACRNTEIVKTMRRLHVGEAVIKRFPLVGDELLRHVANVRAEKRVCHANLTRLERHIAVLHIVSPRFVI